MVGSRYELAFIYKIIIFRTKDSYSKNRGKANASHKSDVDNLEKLYRYSFSMLL